MFLTSTLVDEVSSNKSNSSQIKQETDDSIPKDDKEITEAVPMEEDNGEQGHQEKRNEFAFHDESLHVIARFNERRCHGMPLFGRDLVDALTVVNSIRPVRGFRGSTFNHLRQKGIGYVNCLNATNTTNTNVRPRKRSKIAKEDPEYRYETSALKSLVSMVASRAQIHSDWCDTMVKLPPPILLSSAGWNTQLRRRYSRYILPTLQQVKKQLKYK